MKIFTSYPKNDARLMRLFRKNLLIFSLTIIFFILVSTCSFFVYSTYIYNNQLNDINSNILQRASYTGDALLSQVEHTLIRLSQEDWMRDFLIEQNVLYDVEELRELLKNQRLSNTNIDSINLYNVTGGTVLSEPMEKGAWGAEDTFIYAMQENPSVTHIEVKAYKDNYPYYIRIGRGVYYEGHFGAVVANINVESFHDVLSTVDEKENIKTMILTEDGRIAYMNPLYDRFLKEYTVEGSGDVVAMSMPSKFSGLVYRSEISEAYFIGIRNMYIILIAVMSFVLLIVGAILAMYYTKRSVTPLSMILHTVEHYGEDTGDMKSPVEIQCILDDIRNTMKERRDEDILLALRMLSLKFSQIQALEVQMNPHFLYNSLDTINWMAYMKFGRNNEVSTSIRNLSDMLKYSIDTDAYIVPFEDELKYTGMYEHILKQNYGSSIQIEYLLADQTFGLETVKFLLQPLIENSLHHGLEKGKRSGTIRVSSRIFDDCWEVSVEDDGKGLSPEEIRDLNEKLQRSKELEQEITDMVFHVKSDGTPKYMGEKVLYQEKKGGHGLSNLNRRIKLIFGEDYGVRVEASKMGGLSVVVRQKMVLPDL